MFYSISLWKILEYLSRIKFTHMADKALETVNIPSGVDRSQCSDGTPKGVLAAQDIADAIIGVISLNPRVEVLLNRKSI
jgi:hypothetical protein